MIYLAYLLTYLAIASEAIFTRLRTYRMYTDFKLPIQFRLFANELGKKLSQTRWVEVGGGLGVSG